MLHVFAATMTARFPRKAKTQKGTLTAHRTTSFTKEAVSFFGTDIQSDKPQALKQFKAWVRNVK